MSTEPGDKNTAVTTSRWSKQWSKSQDLRFPPPSTHNLSVKTGARNVSTLRRQKSQQQTWKKSTCRDLRRCECDEWPHCYQASVSDHPPGQNQPDQSCEILRLTQTTFLLEKRRMTRVTLRKPVSPPAAPELATL